MIATGFFDLGKKSAAGISSFYDPAYKKYTLGKYLIYLKVAHCKKLGLQFFYPGYFVPGYSLFDYKLEIGKPVLQYLEFTSSKWRPVAQFSKASSPLQMMFDKLEQLKSILMTNGIECRILKYEFFDANLIPELEGIELFDFPVFLTCDALSQEHPIVFDVRDSHYHWIKCKSVWASTAINSAEDTYSSHVFKFDHGMFSTESANAMATVIADELRSEGNMLRAKSG